jgi:NAD(P)H dehydrogenase (quinone)
VHALWVLAHPSADSLNSHLRDLGTATLRDRGWHVEESDLYRDGWNPILVDEGGCDVEAEQAKLCRADLLVVQFPLWWYGMPAILKGWIDRVFESRFAFDVTDPTTGRSRKYGDGGLVGRRALAVVTAGDRPGSLEPRGISGSIEDVLWPLLHGTFWYTGMKALRPHLIPQARGVASARLLDIEDDLAHRLQQVIDESPLPYLPMDDAHYDHAIRLLPHIAPEHTGNQAHLGETG